MHRASPQEENEEVVSNAWEGRALESPGAWMVARKRAADLRRVARTGMIA